MIVLTVTKGCKFLDELWKLLVFQVCTFWQIIVAFREFQSTMLKFLPQATMQDAE